ncbi:two pore domain potassium channel family protein [Bradyrhizobium jicamae]|uniref:Two pore domain potassium channel family protein n=1 Tax=Bradyrhizobium jicamae TaxID=280332 RepID=A0ABS5FR54_9BRAD|nr:potassium channel family protein [Bradyrhizobium jicamae]MBR0798811.1 two pore domain potassium channel family protein [Bradyrhizobium jicamae]MBR0934702.1 two pore domain potassium channel family protein [Bradyrhizobium jicamae]
MLFQLLVGSAVSAINIAIHSLWTVAVIGLLRNIALGAAGRVGLQLSGVMIAAALALMLAHTLEIVVWALAYWVLGVAPSGTNLLYFAFVNYTTLGYGDITPVKQWLLLGPIAAMNGILMFGWSTAVLFEVLQKTLERQADFRKSP